VDEDILGKMDMRKGVSWLICHIRWLLFTVAKHCSL